PRRRGGGGARDPQDRARPSSTRGGRGRGRGLVTAQTKQRLSAEARRAAVLETACRVFSRSSYRGATTAEIAREAGISEPILYRHFGSKRDLYLACLEHAYDELVAVAEAARAEDPDGCLGTVWKAYMKSNARVRLV